MVVLIYVYLVKVQQCEGELGGRAGTVLHSSDQEDGEVLWSPPSPLQVCVLFGGRGGGGWEDFEHVLVWLR